MQELCSNITAERMEVSEEFEKDTVLPQRLKDYVDDRRKMPHLSFDASTISPQPKP